MQEYPLFAKSVLNMATRHLDRDKKLGRDVSKVKLRPVMTEVLTRPQAVSQRPSVRGTNMILRSPSPDSDSHPRRNSRRNSVDAQQANMELAAFAATVTATATATAAATTTPTTPDAIVDATATSTSTTARRDTAISAAATCLQLPFSTTCTTVASAATIVSTTTAATTAIPAPHGHPHVNCSNEMADTHSQERARVDEELKELRRDVKELRRARALEVDRPRLVEPICSQGRGGHRANMLTNPPARYVDAEAAVGEASDKVGGNGRRSAIDAGMLSQTRETRWSVGSMLQPGGSGLKFET